MSKFGKVLGLVVALLGVTAAVLSVFIAMRAKQARYRTQILATNLSETARVLDSGSGIADKANYKKADADNKEGGSLGWPSAQAAGDLTKGSNSYDATAKQVVTLAGDVIGQRDAIIGTLIKLSAKLECPNAARPNEETMQNLTSYEGGSGAFETFVDNRVRRDKNIAAAINTLLRQLGVSRSYNGDITNGGALSSSDQGVLADAGARFKNLDGNFQSLRGFLKDVAAELQGARVNGVTWTASASDRAYSLSGLDPNTGSALSEVLNKLRADLRNAKAQLNTIDKLKGDISNLQKEVAARDEKLRAMEERIREVSKLVETVYAGGAMEYDRKASAQPLASYSQIKQDLAGRIVKLDAQFGYAVIDLNRSMVVKGVKLSVFRGSTFLGLIKIVEAGEFNSLAVVVSGNAADMAVGDTLVLANAALQGEDVIGQ